VGAGWGAVGAGWGAVGVVGAGWGAVGAVGAGWGAVGAGWGAVGAGWGAVGVVGSVAAGQWRFSLGLFQSSLSALIIQESLTQKEEVILGYQM